MSVYIDPTAYDPRIDEPDEPETWADYLIVTALVLAPFALGFLVGRVTA